MTTSRDETGARLGWMETEFDFRTAILISRTQNQNRALGIKFATVLARVDHRNDFRLSVSVCCAQMLSSKTNGAAHAIGTETRG